MPEQNEKINGGERDALGAIASDSLKTFRAGLFLIVIYISIISLTLQTGGAKYVENIINSFYTINGMMFWIGSMTVNVFTHRMARRVTLKENYSQLWALDDKFAVLNLSSTGTFGLLISVFSLIMGLVEGWINTVNNTSVTVGIEQPLGIIGLALGIVVAIFVIFSMLDSIRERWGPIREIFSI